MATVTRLLSLEELESIGAHTAKQGEVLTEILFPGVTVRYAWFCGEVLFVRLHFTEDPFRLAGDVTMRVESDGEFFLMR